MGKIVKLIAKIKGEAVAEFEYAGGRAQLLSHVCDKLDNVQSWANYVFADGGAGPATPPTLQAGIERSGAKWRVTILADYVRGIDVHTLGWEAGEFSGTRGNALYRAFLAFGDAMQSGAISGALAAADAERMPVPDAESTDAGSAGVGPARFRIVGPPVPKKDHGELVAQETARRVALTDARERERMARAVEAYYAAGGKVPDEVASLPDPRVSRATLAGGPARKACSYQAKEPLGGAPLNDEGNPADGEGVCPECKGVTRYRSGLIMRHLIGGDREPDIPPCMYRGGPPLAGSAADRIHGTCPECRCIVKLGVRKCGTLYIPKHNRYGVPSPASRNLKEKVFAPVGRDGGPERDAQETVAREIKRAARGRVTYRKTGGRGGYVYGKDRAVTFEGNDNKEFHGTRGRGTTDGSATTGRHNLPPVRPERGYLAAAGTFALPMTVRPGIDKGVEGELCPVCGDYKWRAHRNKGAAWRRKHSKAMRAYHEDRAAARDRRAREEIRRGTRLPAADRRKARKAASIGSRAAGTMAASGRVIHAVCVSEIKTDKTDKADK